MADSRKLLEKLSKFGTAKVAGLTCNKNSPMTLRIDVQIPREDVGTALQSLGLEGTDELVRALETALATLRK